MSKKHTLIKQVQIVNEGGTIEADVRIKCNELQLSEARNPIHSIKPRTIGYNDSFPSYQEPVQKCVRSALQKFVIRMKGMGPLQNNLSLKSHITRSRQ